MPCIIANKFENVYENAYLSRITTNVIVDIGAYMIIDDMMESLPKKYTININIASIILLVNNIVHTYAKSDLYCEPML